MDKRSNVTTILASAALGAALALGGSFYMFTKVQNEIAEHREQTPPTVIVDFAQLAELYKTDSPEEAELVMTHVNEAILRLQRAGFIVLDGQAVLAAPSIMYLSKELLEQ